MIDYILRRLATVLERAAHIVRREAMMRSLRCDIASLQRRLQFANARVHALEAQWDSPPPKPMSLGDYAHRLAEKS